MQKRDSTVKSDMGRQGNFTNKNVFGKKPTWENFITCLISCKPDFQALMDIFVSYFVLCFRVLQYVIYCTLSKSSKISTGSLLTVILFSIAVSMASANPAVIYLTVSVNHRCQPAVKPRLCWKPSTNQKSTNILYLTVSFCRIAHTKCNQKQKKYCL